MALGDQGLNRFRAGLQAVQQNNDRLNPLFSASPAQTAPSGLTQAAVRNQLLADAAGMTAPAQRALRFPQAAISDDIIQQALGETHTQSIMGELPAAGQTGGPYNPPPSARVARAQSILAGAGDDIARVGASVRPVGNPLAIGAGLTDDIIMQAAMSSAATPRVTPTGAVAGVADDVARAVPGAAGVVPGAVDKGTGFLARLRGGLTPNLSRGALLRGAGYAGAGIFGRGLVDQMNIGGEGSTWDNILAGSAAGAGVGAGLGSIIPGVGTGIGAAVGTVVGGALEGLFGDKSNKEGRIQEAYDTTSNVIRDLGARFGLNEEYMSNIMLSYEAQARMMMEAGDEEGMKALTEQMKVGLADTMLQYRMEQEMERKQQERMLGIQQQFAPIFSSIVDRSALNSEAAYGQALVAADNLAASNPQLAELVRMNAANSRSSNDALMAAYASQAALGMAGSLEEQYAVQANTQPVTL